MRTDEFSIHEVQIKILKELLFKPAARFRDLNVTDLSNDHFSFHVNKLLDVGLVVKGNQRYTLTQKGKEFANRMDTESLKMERQAKISVVGIAVRERAGTKQYLTHTRLKEPYFGFLGFVCGKVRWGEKAVEAVKREFLEETGLVGDFSLKGIEHKMDFSKGGKLLEDKFFMIFRVDNTKGTLEEKIQGGENKWLTKEKIENNEFLFDDIILLIDMINRDEISFCENTFTVQKY